ncbi:MAG: 50S ribosomal protein L29 [Pseudomonadales bacterium]|nr:50S ribosomal protein L29 [Candidatus Woesebacteria bacterium]MCB9801713.1 50S ribosomal protein L29 [Pseudomonadales bacterium]
MKRYTKKTLADKSTTELKELVSQLRTESAQAMLEKRAGTGRTNVRFLRDQLARVLTILSQKERSEALIGHTTDKGTA